MADAANKQPKPKPFKRKDNEDSSKGLSKLEIIYKVLSKVNRYKYSDKGYLDLVQENYNDAIDFKICDLLNSSYKQALP